jgi:hypothetical protein
LTHPNTPPPLSITTYNCWFPKPLSHLLSTCARSHWSSFVVPRFLSLIIPLPSTIVCFPKRLSPSKHPSKLLLKLIFHSWFHNHLQLGMSFPSARHLVSTHPRSYWSLSPLDFTHHVWQLHHNFEKAWKWNCSRVRVSKESLERGSNAKQRIKKKQK